MNQTYTEWLAEHPHETLEYHLLMARQHELTEQVKFEQMMKIRAPQANVLSSAQAELDDLTKRIDTFAPTPFPLPTESSADGSIIWHQQVRTTLLNMMYAMKFHISLENSLHLMDIVRQLCRAGFEVDLFISHDGVCSVRSDAFPRFVSEHTVDIFYERALSIALLKYTNEYWSVLLRFYREIHRRRNPEGEQQP